MVKEQVANMIPHLKAGAKYLFDHKRKGQFVAEFRGTSPTPESDTVDSLFIEVDIFTEEGSGQEWLASNVFARDEYGRKMRPLVSKRHIRPSLLNSISAPSTDARRLMAMRFDEAQKKAAEAAGVTITHPSRVVLDRVEEVARPEKKSFWKRLFRR